MYQRLSYNHSFAEICKVVSKLFIYICQSVCYLCHVILFSNKIRKTVNPFFPWSQVLIYSLWWHLFSNSLLLICTKTAIKLIRHANTDWVFFSVLFQVSEQHQHHRWSGQFLVVAKFHQPFHQEGRECAVTGPVRYFLSFVISRRLQ